MFRLIPDGPESSDCTAPYKIDLGGPYTVEEFIRDVLLNTTEWGSIYIYTGNHYADPCCEYCYGKIVTQLIPDDFMKLKVVSGRSRGGWTAMDYYLHVERIDGEFKQITEHYGALKEDIYGPTKYAIYPVGDVSPDSCIAKFEMEASAIVECKYLERLYLTTIKASDD